MAHPFSFFLIGEKEFLLNCSPEDTIRISLQDQRLFPGREAVSTQIRWSKKGF